MATLEIVDAQKSFGPVKVLDHVSLSVANGEFLVIVGPSGCGKSTLLRAIAGLEELTGGEIAIGGRDIGGLAPAERGIAMVFQSYALYPHLSLYENMAFALRLAKRPKAEIDAAVHRAANILGIENLLDRKPAALSGGQRQRVAIGRAIVRQPDVFLFDEPLSNLDAALRVRMRYEFAALHRTLSTTTVYVTHDQVEAMTLADRIVVMRDGVIEQIGTPKELYERPANRFVAAFIGSPQMNFIDGTLVANGAEDASVELPDGNRIALLGEPDHDVGAPVTLGIRPEHVERAEAGKGINFTVRFVERLGGTATVHLARKGDQQEYMWSAREPFDLGEGATVALQFPADRIHLFGADGVALHPKR